VHELDRNRIVEAERVTDWLTGSPAKRNIEKAMMPTAIMTPMAWIARRRVKASMRSFHVPLWKNS
jgi:hypothetical protein